MLTYSVWRVKLKAFQWLCRRVANIQGQEGRVRGILVVSQDVSCQHTGLGRLGERHLSDFPGCRLPTYKAKRVG